MCIIQIFPHLFSVDYLHILFTLIYTKRVYLTLHTEFKTVCPTVLLIFNLPSQFWLNYLRTLKTETIRGNLFLLPVSLHSK